MFLSNEIILNKTDTKYNTFIGISMNKPMKRNFWLKLFSKIYNKEGCFIILLADEIDILNKINIDNIIWIFLVFNRKNGKD